mmetsp:Transcript_8732/g.27257  ORF Transcript_8732/g.27257 Transcript_8732/m.27257 type:complete len:190 (-) Transcript_8732:101-670(-)
MARLLALLLVAPASALRPVASRRVALKDVGAALAGALAVTPAAASALTADEQYAKYQESRKKLDNKRDAYKSTEYKSKIGGKNLAGGLPDADLSALANKAGGKRIAASSSAKQGVPSGLSTKTVEIKAARKIKDDTVSLKELTKEPVGGGRINGRDLPGTGVSEYISDADRKATTAAAKLAQNKALTGK